MTLPAIEANGMSYRYKSPGGMYTIRLKRLSLNPGDIAILSGPSGVGKSTILDMLGLVRRPDVLEHFVVRDREGGEHDVTAPLREGKLDELAGVRGRMLGYVLQQGGLLPFLTVADNIRLAGAGVPMALTKRLGIADLLDRLPKALSIGQRQRVSVARALAHAPAVLLADEPVASLDPATAEATMGLLAEVACELGTAVVLSNHNTGLASGLAHGWINAAIGEDQYGRYAEFSQAGHA